MSTVRLDGNTAAFHRVLDAANAHDAALLSKTVDEVFAPDALIATPLPIHAAGAQVIKEVFATLHRAFPDLHVEVEDVIAEADRVVSRHRVTGTHRGSAYMGLAPTGRSIAYDEIFVLRFADGRITQTWGVVDVFAQLKQLGFVLSPPKQENLS
jgi:predicted ester cyclase